MNSGKSIFLPILAAGIISVSALNPVNDRSQELIVEQNIEYANYGKRKMHLDLFRPDDGQVLPAVVVIHGGGWHQGDKEHFNKFAEAIAKAGYVCISVEYRLSGEALFPAAIHDCKAAVRWLRASAEKYGVDGDLVASLGGSAGGHLAALLATTSGVMELEGQGGNEHQSTKIQACVIYEAPVDQYDKHKGKSRGETPANSLNFFGGTCDEKPELYKLGSPVRFIDEGTPPTLFINNGDNPYSERLPFQEKLDELGIHNEYLHFEGGKHGSWNRPPLFEKYVEASIKFLDRQLKD